MQKSELHSFACGGNALGRSGGTAERKCSRAVLRHVQTTNNKVMRRCVTRLSSGTRLMATDLLDGVCALRVHEDVATITLNHAPKRNALGREMIGALHEHVQALKDDKTIRALVVASVEGAPVFSSGHNLVELSASDRGQQAELMRTSTRTMLDLQSLPFPVLCLVDGLAAAAGAQLVAHCDMAYCTARSTFSTPGIRYGKNFRVLCVLLCVPCSHLTGRLSTNV